MQCFKESEGEIRKPLSDQCKEIEENSRMGKACDLFKKIRDTKGISYAKMGTIKDRDCMELTEAEGGKNTQKNYTKKIFVTHIIHDMCDHLPRSRHPGI